MSRIRVEVNSEIRKILANKTIPIHDGVGFLLCLYYGVHPSYVPKELERRILACGIVSKDYSTDEVIWIVPLFEETIIGFEWIGDWMDLFKAVNPGRRGVKSEVLRRMKTFFMNNPTVRMQDVMEATKLYLKSVEEAKYCKKSHKFIAEGDGTSMLLDYVQQAEVLKSRIIRYNKDVI